MLDLETMGTSSNSLILSIGAVEFDNFFGKEIIEIKHTYSSLFNSAINPPLRNNEHKVIKKIKAAKNRFQAEIKIIRNLRKQLKEYETSK